MNSAPLAEQLRPTQFAGIAGQEHLLGEKGFITNTIANGKPLSILLWGPPGCGKTSIARLYAKAFSMRFESISAIFSGVADLKRIIKDLEDSPLLGQAIVLFVDEIHRFNKAQQDAFLPYIENGKVILVGATAENPSFYLNNALLSRLRVLKLNALTEEALNLLLVHYENKKKPLNFSAETRALVINLAQGDGRYLFNLIENLEHLPSNILQDVEAMQNFLQKRAPLYDKGDDQHYNIISALHKSVRGSDPDAALYWFARMLEGGEEPLFIARRLIRMASEDVGLADPQALTLAVAAKDTYEMLGSPEGELALAQVVVYLALAPKSNAVYKAYKEVRELAAQTSHLNPPSTILNAPTQMMKKMGYGAGYEYDHDTVNGFSGQNYFPVEMERVKIYQPVDRGFERDMNKRINYFNKLRCDLNKKH